MWLFKRKKAEPVIPEHYVLYPGAFREEFEWKGKTPYHFYLRPADTHFCGIDEAYVRQTKVLAELLGRGVKLYALEDESSWTLENYGVQTWDYFALRRGSEEIEENCLENKREWFQEHAELSIISDYDHGVWTILLGDGYSYQLLTERLKVFCESMGAFLQIEK